MNRYWAEGLIVEPSSLHDGDEAWFKDRPVQVAGHLFPPRFRIWLSCNATGVDMCVALEVDRGGFVEQVNATTIGGVPSDQEKDWIRAAARKLALPLALSMIPYGPFQATEEGWEWIADGWGPPRIRRLCDAMPDPQIALVKELRRRTGPRWWGTYLPRIEKTAQIIWDAPADLSTRQVIETLVCPGMHVGRTTAYEDLAAARELGLLPGRRVP
ncbi:hypothetical protein AB0O51_26905 [Streptomyces sp. NPDC090301]|uniref:hypothetical protein n=1 Tax=Streptomyces sp. NPDC090301 TaxID=3154975 RepID=UPI003428C967